tara:strand:- start:525 stop:854 length:330 start_codon:yes stop_codon:yes gene_type:complete
MEKEHAEEVERDETREEEKEEAAPETVGPGDSEGVLSLDKTLENLHVETAQLLLDRIRAGEATAADLSVARQFLKDNGVDSTLYKDSPMTNLAEVLPFNDPEEPVAQNG